MAVNTRMAVVKLDPIETGSTGGEVIDIVDWFSVKEARKEGNSIPADYSDAAGPYKVGGKLRSLRTGAFPDARDFAVSAFTV